MQRYWFFNLDPPSSCPPPIVAGTLETDSSTRNSTWRWSLQTGSAAPNSTWHQSIHRVSFLGRWRRDSVLIYERIESLHDDHRCSWQLPNRRRCVDNMQRHMADAIAHQLHQQIKRAIWGANSKPDSDLSIVVFTLSWYLLFSVMWKAETATSWWWWTGQDGRDHASPTRSHRKRQREKWKPSFVVHQGWAKPWPMSRKHGHDHRSRNFRSVGNIGVCVS